MKSSVLIYGCGGLLIGLIIGFWVANAASRNSPVSGGRQNLPASKTTQNLADKNEALAPEEITQALSAAENRKDDLVFQKNLGLALYQYAKVQNENGFTPDLIKLLERANQLSDRKDSEILAALADSYFIRGKNQNDSDSIEKSRKAYAQVISLKPADNELKTAYAATFLFSPPPQPTAAINELNAVLRQNSNNQAALQLLILALIKSGKIELAKQKLSELKTLNPSNPAISELEPQISQQKIRK